MASKSLASLRGSCWCVCSSTISRKYRTLISSKPSASIVFRLILLLMICVRTKSRCASVSRICSRMNFAFSCASIDPNVSTCTSCRISLASLMLPSASRALASIIVSRARSTSTWILPSVTVRSVSINPSCASPASISSMNSMTLRTAAPTVLLSCARRLLRMRMCALSAARSRASQHTRTMTSASLEVAIESRPSRVFFSAASNTSSAPDRLPAPASASASLVAVSTSSV
mmetsp:Transcript_9070/g.32043  ORF Transcript_9070/g.32043 Transcript_9070/m.32043 type:complete len:231 (+) Transcript_9070:723-1415(+)